MTCRFGPRFVGDPIDVITGEARDVVTDFSVWFRTRGSKDVGPDAHAKQGRLFQFERWYGTDLATDVDRGLGFGHWHSLDWTLRQTVDGYRVWHPGGSFRFPGMWADGDEMRSYEEPGYALKREADHHFILRRDGEPTYHFVRLIARSRDLMLLRIDHVDGGITDLSYEQGPVGNTALKHRLSTVDDSDGYRLRFSWVGNHIESVCHSVHGSSDETELIRYQYDAEGNLTSGKDAYNTTFTWQYGPNHNVVRRQDRRGYAFVYEYDSKLRCIRVAGEDGVDAVRLEYDEAALETRVLHEGNGAEFLYRFLPGGHLQDIRFPDGSHRVFIYDDGFRRVQEVDAGGSVSTVLFDALGSPVGQIDAFGFLRDLGEDPSKEVAPALTETVPSSVLAAEGAGVLLPEEFDLPPASELPGHPDVLPDPLRAVLRDREVLGTRQHIRDVQGLLLRTEHRSQSGVRTRRFGYDPNGNLRHLRDADGGDTYFTYSSWNHLTEERDPLGNTLRFTHNARDKMESVADAGGTLTQYVWDARDELHAVYRNGVLCERYLRNSTNALIEKRIAVRDSEGHVSGEATLVTYERGPLQSLLARKTNRAVDGFGVTQTFKRDSQGRSVQVASEVALATSFPKSTCTLAYAYPESLRVKDERTAGDDFRGVTREYDTLADGTRVLSAWTVRLTKDGPEYLVQYSTEDKDVRPCPLGSSVPLLIPRVPGEGPVVVKILDPRGRTHTVRKAARGVLDRELANGVREVSQYDSFGRVVARAHLAARQPPPVPKEPSDPTDRMLAEGRLRQAARAQPFVEVEQRNYTYSTEGRLLLAQSTRGTRSYHYDAAQRLAAITQHDGQVDEYLYDSASNLRRKPDLHEGWVHAPSAAAGTATPPAMAHAGTNEPVSLAPGNQLFRANGERFFYDTRGNVAMRESHNLRTYYLRCGLGHLRQVWQLAITADVQQQLQDGYLERAMLELPSAHIVFEADFDGLGRRIAKIHYRYERDEKDNWTCHKDKTEFVWDSERIAAEILPSGAARIYLYQDDEALVPFGCIDCDHERALPESGKFYSFHADHRGAIEIVRDEQAAIVWQEHIGPFGELQPEPPEADAEPTHYIWDDGFDTYGKWHPTQSKPGAPFHQPLRLVGQYFDHELGLAQHRYRSFDPALGRFLERDPLGLEGSTNVYAWPSAEGRVGCPLDVLDPLGLGPTCPHADPPPGATNADTEQPPQLPQRRTGAIPGAPPRRRGEKLNEDHLTPTQVRHFREQIDNAPNAQAALQARYDRHCVSRQNRDMEPMEPAAWKVSHDRLQENRRRGIKLENDALDDLGVDNNNRGRPQTRTTPDGFETRPDGLTSRSVIDVKSLPDTPNADGSPRVLYDSDQLRGQRLMAEDPPPRTHVIVITNANRDAVRPSRPQTPVERPDGTIVESSVYHRDSTTERWSQWIVSEQNPRGAWTDMDNRPHL